MARFYDPAIAHFVQADTIIPNPFSSHGWNRYSYVNNNPIRYNDPSGHRVCEQESNCNSTYIPSSSTITQWIKRDFSWSVAGNISKSELGIIYGAGSKIQNYIDKIGGNGGQWIKKNLGETVFEKNIQTINQTNKLCASAFVWPYNTVRMGNYSLDSNTLIHELGHVLDNNQKGGIIPATVNGGGPADDMVSGMVGHPERNILRMIYGNVVVKLKPLQINIVPNHQEYVNNVAGSSPWPTGDYANNGVSDDFANTFRYTITGENNLTSKRIKWMETYIINLPY